MKFRDEITLDFSRARAATPDEIRDCACGGSRNDSPTPPATRVAAAIASSPTPDADPDAARARWLDELTTIPTGLAWVPIGQQQTEIARANQAEADAQLERQRAAQAERERLAREARDRGAREAREAALESARAANAQAIAGVLSAGVRK